MNADKRVRMMLLKALQARRPDSTPDMVWLTDEDCSLRSQLVSDVLSKALNYSKLVRVERPTSRNGKTFMTHKWVKPDQVKKTDKVVGNRALYEQWKHRDLNPGHHD